MRFLELNEVAEWCGEHSIGIDDHWKPTWPASTRVLERIAYAEGDRSTPHEHAAAAECVRQLGDWSACLLLVLDWDIWSSTEDWPAYYAARGCHGEKRSLQTAPGHLFEWTERDELIRFLTMVMQNGWDADLLPAVQGPASRRRVFVSHHEWAEVRELPL